MKENKGNLLDWNKVTRKSQPVSFSKLLGKWKKYNILKHVLHTVE